MQDKYNRVKISLLISTYNWPEALTLCLESISRQSIMPDEILIADDGSTQDTYNVIEDYRTRVNVPILHIWHKDDGFRLSQIRNKAIAESSCDYIIQIDGDLILDANFIKDHRALIRPNYFVIGSRALLTKEFSDKILKSKLLPAKSELNKDTKNTLNTIRIPWATPFLANHYKTKGKYIFYARGCNMAFWKNSILMVNGYNEDISGWGSEDTELTARLIKSGQKKLFLKFGAITYHIWHNYVARDRKDANNTILLNTIKEESFLVENGINKYLK